MGGFKTPAEVRATLPEGKQVVAFQNRNPVHNAHFELLVTAQKMAGPREAIQHMIIRKNFGATHFIIGRDMAGTKSTLTSDDFYGAFEAQEMGKKHSAELEMTVVDYPNMVYVGEEHGNARGYISDKL